MDISRLIHFTQQLIRAQSLSGEEEGVISRITEEMRALGYDRVWVDEVGSAIGIVEGNRPGPLLLLDAHCDTVSADPLDWTHDPFGGEIEGGYLYGRGAADTKGNLAAMIHAAADLQRSRLSGRVAVSATVSEEVMEGVSLKAIVQAVQPDYVVIGEATDLGLNRGGRGRAEIVLQTFGKPAHSSSPEVGRCAVHEMMAAIKILDELPLGRDDLLGPAQMVLTDILSEPYPGHSVIPSRCRCTFDRRLLPGETPQSVITAVKTALQACRLDFQASVISGKEKTWKGAILESQKFFPGWVIPEDHLLVVKALEGLTAAGLKPSLSAFRFCTNGSYSAGIAGIPTIGFGLGREQDAHTIDERISLNDLEAAVLGYGGIIQSVLAA